MPKFGAHMIIAEEACARRPHLYPAIDMNALRFGAIGPDTALFLMDPVGKLPYVRDNLATALSVLSTIQKIREDVERITAELSEPFEDIKDWLSGGLTKDLRYTINASIEALLLAAKLGIAWGLGTVDIKNPALDSLRSLPREMIDSPNALLENWIVHGRDNFGFPFRLFGHPYTCDGKWKKPLPDGDYSEWWWMDLLHYRKTGEFARRLLERASGKLQNSYARGYLAHVAGDICGHPYINAIVGGPFRNHAYRHIVLETLVDVRLWSAMRNADVLAARLDELIDLTDDDADQIAQLVIQVMRDTYKPPMVPSFLSDGYPTPGEWTFAYRSMQQYLRLSTSGAFPRPTPPPSTPREVIEELKQLLKKNDPGGPPNWNGDIADFIKSLFSWLGKGVALLVMVATLVPATIMRLAQAEPRWLIYLLNLGLFYIISAIRTMLCLSGWGYCSSEDLTSFDYLNDLIRVQGTGDEFYPLATVPVPKPPFYWLQPPDRAKPKPSPPEPPGTWPIVPQKWGLTPEWILDPANRIDPHAVLALGHAISPAETMAIQQPHLGVSVFGNAADFSNAMLDGSIPIFDFDLDGDRGYGFLPWEGLPPNSRYL